MVMAKTIRWTRAKMMTYAEEATRMGLVLGERIEELHIIHILGQRQVSIQEGYDNRRLRIPNSRILALKFHLNPETRWREYETSEG